MAEARPGLATVVFHSIVIQYLSEDERGALTALLWAGLVRLFLLHHVTWSINSVCHFFGNRRFQTDDHSTNVFWLALPSLGESWHHNHHAFPRSAFHGLRWYEIDLSGWLILGMQKVGLARNVITISPERQEVRQREGLKRARIDADAPLEDERPLDRVAS